MQSWLLNNANNAFMRGDYHTARNAYRAAANSYGDALFRANVQLCARRERARFVKGAIQRPDYPQPENEPLITYCVPAYNRLGDIERNLLPNLEVLSQFRNVKLLLNLFDIEQEAYSWVKLHCRPYIKSGLLQVNREKPLTQWHAPTVRNSFARYLKQGYYAALDSDNRLTTENVIRTKQAIAEFGPCIIHHFQGRWGDGTCGRITLPVDAYKESGYTQQLLPRQFDDLSLIANALKNHPQLTLITEANVNILKKSRQLRDLVKLNRWRIQGTPCDLGELPIPDDAKPEGYTQQDPTLKAFEQLNGGYSLLKASTLPAAQTEFRRRLDKTQKRVMESEVFPDIAKLTLEPRTPIAPARSGQTHIAVIERFDERVKAWVAQQRKRGYQRFLLVDASAEEPSQTLGEGVYLFKPRLGDAETFKDFWVACLSQRYKTSQTEAHPLPVGDACRAEM